MKPMFYFLVALTVVLAATANAGEPVLDSDGDIITNGSYFVLPAIAGAIGGGLNLSADPWLKCPHYIGQEDPTVNRGFPGSHDLMGCCKPAQTVSSPIRHINQDLTAASPDQFGTTSLSFSDSLLHSTRRLPSVATFQ
uniref:Uncharacterized protein n=1 Tax=Brassica oleracea var. oleracea TaxID=109376 RepID=A0A0D3D0B5_BRAOL